MKDKNQGRRARSKHEKPDKGIAEHENEIADEWRNGRTIKDIAKEYGVSYTVIREILLAHDEEIYRETARIRRARRRKELSVTNSKLREEWKNGMSTRDLADKYNVSRQTIERRLKENGEEEYRDIAKRKIASSIAEIAKQKVILTTLSEIYEQFKSGKSTGNLAEEYGVSRQTISRMLAKFNKEEYKTLAKQRMLAGNAKDTRAPTSGAGPPRWENGESQEDSEKSQGID
jgi:transposase